MLLTVPSEEEEEEISSMNVFEEHVGYSSYYQVNGPLGWKFKEALLVVDKDVGETYADR